MRTTRVSLLARFPVKVAFTAVTLGAVALSGNTFAESSVQPKSTQVERPVIEKTIEPRGSNASAIRFGTFNAVAATERYIVGLVDESVARYRGGVQGYEATSTEGKSKLNVRSSKAVAYTEYLATTQEKLLNEMSRQLGRTVTPLNQFQLAANAMVVELTKEEAKKVAQLRGVRSIAKDQVFQLHQTETTNGYALPTDTNGSMNMTVLGVALAALLALAFFAYRRGWLGRNSAIFAMLASTLGMAGCYYEGGFSWIGAPEIWRGSYDLPGTMGEGVVVGIIDTGINPISDSFSEVSGDGYRHTNPKGKYFGVCDPETEVYDPKFPCNDKLIGAWGFEAIAEGSPRDEEGHGSHTAGTTAGNIVYNATVTAPTGFEVSKTIAGVSPRSNIIAYRVCNEQGCHSSAILFAVNQAIADGVDVINYSIGGRSNDPWAASDALAFLSAMDAGIFVAVSAGNEGPDFATLSSPADSPWTTAVAASSHNFFYKNSLVGLVNDQGDRLPEIIGQSITPAFGPAAIVDAADYGNPLCLEGQFTSKFEGQIVLCDAGEIARVGKGENVKANGGSALILTRPPMSSDGSGYLEADTHVIPATHITYKDAAVLRAWLAKGTGHRGSLSGTTPELADDYADVLAYFSSRGVSPSVPGIVKPNVTAPGRAIFAAFNEDYSDAEQDYNIIQGTSMSSPHVAGAGALLTALHPDWTPMQIQSALMTTASLDHTKEDGETQADPFDVGGGRIDLPMAARAALLLDEDQDGFLAADPLAGGDPSKLNLTGLGNDSCVVNCTWTRTVTNVSSRATRWMSRDTASVTVEPKFFMLAPGESTELTFTADVTAVEPDEWLFDQVSVQSLTPGIPSAHFPVAAQSARSDLPGAISITASQDSDIVTLPGLKAIEITDATVEITGLAKSEAHRSAAVSDPTNGDPFDGSFDPAVDGVALFIVDVPAGSTRFVAEITESVSGDLDLFIGTGDTPEFDTLLTYSATPSALELVNVMAPPEGKMWIIVQNWEVGHDTPTDFTLHTAAIQGEVGNMTVEVPYTQPAGELFDANISFVLPGSEPGDRYYGSFALGTDSANPGNLGTVMVDLVRE